MLWNTTALTFNVFTELGKTVKYGGGVSYNIIFTEYPFKWISGDVNAFHKILDIVVNTTAEYDSSKLILCWFNVGQHRKQWPNIEPI